MTPVVAVLLSLLAVSEALVFIPGVKSNSIFQLVVGIIRTLIPTKPL